MTKHGYVRVSRLDVDDSDQRDALLGAGVRSANVFADVVSGMTPTSSRPGWRMLLEELRRGDTVVVAALDRLGRDHTDVALTLEELEHRGVAVRALRDGLDTSREPGPTLAALASVLQHPPAPSPSAA